VIYHILIILLLYIVFKLSDGIIAAIDRWRIKRSILSNPIKRYEYYRSGYTIREVRRLRRLPYRDYLKSYHWDLVRSAALKRDGNKCSDCGADCAERPLEVHHINYARKGNENLDDLMTLCRECHEERHFIATAFE
jgi:5-methylcytosine-specific restriction endonuclease McrA